MEQNLPIITKKAWNLIRVMFFMLKKGISKAKFTTSLNMMIKRGKIASKSLHKLLFHHHHNWVFATLPRHLPPPPSDDENEFSCTATPQNQNKLNYHLDANDVIVKALEILKNATASPALSRFGKSPMVKEVRITDSPFPLSNGDEDGDHVDEAAEKFIMRFEDLSSHVGGFLQQLLFVFTTPVQAFAFSSLGLRGSVSHMICSD
ncbi:hypothetical protein Tco_1295417 [Tanacetum coccineum]